MENKIIFAKLLVKFLYKKVIPMQKTFYMPVTVNNNNELIFKDYELTKLHKKIFTPKEKNSIKSIEIEKTLFTLDTVKNHNDDLRLRYNYKELINKINKK